MSLKLVVYGDCIPADPEEVPESKKFPGLVAAACGVNDTECLYNCGETTHEAVLKIDQLLLAKPDIVILNWGLNDAAPRGLMRKTRSRIIRAMYRLRMGKGMRLFCRTYFLNPLEYALQLIRPPRFYLTSEETCANFRYLFGRLRQQGVNRIVVVSINPIANYRFRNANRHIEHYNQALRDLCADENVFFADAYARCLSEGIGITLGADKFHYSLRGHEIAAEVIADEVRRLL